MSNRSAARGTAAASSIRLTLRTSNAVATSNASPSRCFLFCEGSRAARSARTAAATVSTPPIPKAPSNQRRSPPTTSSFQGARILMGGEDWSLRELEACRQRVAVEAPHELRRHPEATRHVWLAAYAHLRGRAVTDTLVDLLIETVHHIGARAEHKVEQELLDDLKRVGGKQSLLFDLAGAAVEKPDGTVREVLFPVVGEQTPRDLVRESKATGPTYRTTLRATIRSSYRGHYRRAVLDLLAVLDFRSNNDVHRPVIRALDLIRRYAKTRVRAYPVEEDVPLDGIVRPLWRDAVVDQDPQGRPRIDRITDEICALEALCDQLRCKEVWVAGANRYRNPDEDLPADFDAQRAGHYQALDLPLDASARRSFRRPRGGYLRARLLRDWHLLVLHSVSAHRRGYEPVVRYWATIRETVVWLTL